ncbi:DUF1127 domain-containing protein [Rhodosalinus sp. 5P4]|uniref:DUF1127 domain-containing protein n=2 Tax=Rhodosalinus TaxID=2047740 RepID=UPI00352660B7
MTDSTATDFAPTRRSGFMAFLVAIGDALAMASDVGRRVHRVDTLNDMTDDELAARGLKRDEIVQHVFRDLYYI